MIVRYGLIDVNNFCLYYIGTTCFNLKHCRVGGLKGTEIGEMMGVDYSTVSQERKRLREKLKSDKNVSKLIQQRESGLSF